MFELVLRQGDPKKHSVVYKGEGDGFSLAIYVPRVVLQELGYPEELRVTLDRLEEVVE